MANVTKASTPSCTDALAPRLMRRPPKAAPTRPPPLQAAWNEDMIARPQRRSTTLACAFIGTSTRILNTPNRNAQIANGAIPGERTCMSGKAARSAAKIGPVTRKVGPVPPMRGGRSPATGMAAIAPAPAANSTSESVASVRPNSALTRGIATAQEPMANPLAKKIAVTPMRARIRVGSSFSTDAGAVVIPVGLRRRSCASAPRCRFA